MNEKNFAAIKAEILRRAKVADACTEQYGRAYKAETLAELMGVIKDNFWWACNNKVLTPDIFELYHDEFAENNIFCNENVTSGFLLAYDNSTVKAWGNSTVEAYDNSYCTSYDVIKCKLHDNAIWRVRSENKIYFANEGIKFEKQ